MSFPNVEKANDYIKSVIKGNILSCEWVKLACKRHVSDLKKSKKVSFPYEFDEVSAERVCKFVQNMPHIKGKWVRTNEKIKLEPWQCFFLAMIFGWKIKKNGRRRFRKAFLFVPRKNAKSTIAAAIGLYMLTADNEHGAEVYSGATTEKQAHEVFNPAKLMAQKTPEFIDYYGVEVFASNIAVPGDGSKFQPIIGNPGDGSSPSCAIIDEYHEHKDDRMYDTMLTGMGAREQPLMLMITTAGDNLAGPCYQMQSYSQKILEGSIVDEETFPLIYCADPNDDWMSEDALIKANPNYGISVDQDFLKSQLLGAKNNSRKQSTYKTKHLNQWVGSKSAFFNMQKWKQCEDTSLKLEDYKGQKCYLSLDLASKRDIAALGILIETVQGEYVVFGKYYLPEESIQDGTNEHYRGWALDGWLTLTDGAMIDFNVIKEDILELSENMLIKEIAYDPFQATMLVTDLMNNGLPVVEMRQTVQNMSDPMKTLEGLIFSGKIGHNGDPLMTWMMSNVVAKIDAKDNVYPRKENEENKIDGAVALIMALNRAINGGADGGGYDMQSIIDNIISVNL